MKLNNKYIDTIVLVIVSLAMGLLLSVVIRKFIDDVNTKDYKAGEIEVNNCYSNEDTLFSYTYEHGVKIGVFTVKKMESIGDSIIVTTWNNDIFIIDERKYREYFVTEFLDKNGKKWRRYYMRNMNSWSRNKYSNGKIIYWDY